jgi:hypothetical protein
MVIVGSASCIAASFGTPHAALPPRPNRHKPKISSSKSFDTPCDTAAEDMLNGNYGVKMKNNNFSFLLFENMRMRRCQPGHFFCRLAFCSHGRVDNGCTIRLCVVPEPKMKAIHHRTMHKAPPRPKNL